MPGRHEDAFGPIDESKIPPEPPAVVDVRDGATRIADERRRQIEKEGWSPEHDDEHDDGSLAMAAACYAAPERIYVKETFAAGESFVDPWPWNGFSDSRPHNGNILLPVDSVPVAKQIRLLEKAGALIAAEIDRMLRAKRKRK